MRLKSLKLNNRTYFLNTKINIFLGEKNTGKTTLFHLIKFIYGAEFKSDKELYKAFANIAKQHSNYLISWAFDDSTQTEYQLNLTTKKIIMEPNKQEISISNYSEYINNKYHYYNEVFNIKIKSIECFSHDEDLTKKLNSSGDYAKFFQPHKDMTYTAICFLRLLKEHKLASSLQKYFSLYGKVKNIKNIIDSSKDLNKELPTDLIDVISSDSLTKFNVQKYIELVKLNNTDIDKSLFKELENICKNIDGFDINAVKEFHSQLLHSYNEIIENEKDLLRKEVSVLNNYTKSEMKEAITYTNLISEMNDEIKKLSPQLQESSIELNSLNDEIENISNKLNEFCLEFNNNFSVIKQFNNCLEFREKSNKKTHIVLNLKNSTHDDSSSGGSDTITNFIGFLTYTLIHSSFPIMLFEKAFLSENQNETIILLIKKITDIIDDSKSIFVTLHPDEELKNIDDSNVNIITCEHNFFNLNF